MRRSRKSVYSLTTPHPDATGGFHLVTTTVNFQFFALSSLGQRGDDIATDLAANCERDYATLQGWFKKSAQRLPFQGYVDGTTPGASHPGCGDPRIMVGTNDSLQLPPDGYRVLLSAEVVEVLEAAVR